MARKALVQPDVYQPMLLSGLCMRQGQFVYAMLKLRLEIEVFQACCVSQHVCTPAQYHHLCLTDFSAEPSYFTFPSMPVMHIACMQ